MYLEKYTATEALEGRLEASKAKRVTAKHCVALRETLGKPREEGNGKFQE